MSWKKVTDASELKVGDRVKYTRGRKKYEGKLVKFYYGLGIEGYSDMSLVTDTVKNTLDLTNLTDGYYKYYESTMDNLQKGDLLVDKLNKYRRVLGVGEGVFFMSDYCEDKNDDYLKDAEGIYTLFELKKHGYKLVNEDTETIKVGDAEYNKAEFEEATKDLKRVNK